MIDTESMSSIRVPFMRKIKFLKTIAIASGSIGVGKTTVAANLALAMNKLGRKVMLINSDFGLSNLEELLHAPPESLSPLTRRLSIRDILMEGPGDVNIIAAGTGPQKLAVLTECQRLTILDALDGYTSDIDVLLIDTASRISENAAFFCSSAQEIIILISPEQTSIADAASLIAVLFSKYQEKQFRVLVNLAKNDEQALAVFRRLSLATDPCQSISLDYLGNLPRDKAVQTAVHTRRAFVDLAPQCPASQGIIEIGKKLLKSRDKVKGTLQFCFGQLLTASSGFPR